MSDHERYQQPGVSIPLPVVLALIGAGFFVGALVVYVLMSGIGETVLNDVLP